MNAIDIHPNNRKYKELVLNAPYEICIERARYFTESYKMTEGQHPAIRSARAFEHTLRNMTIYILDCESIVGNRSKKLVGTVIPVERGETNSILELDLDLLTTRKRQPYRIDIDDRRELEKEILPYWRKKTLRYRKNQLWKKNGLFFRPSIAPWSFRKRKMGLDIGKLLLENRSPKKSIWYRIKGMREVLYNNPALIMNVFDVQGHLILGLRNVLRDGFSGIRDRAASRLERAKAEGDREGQSFLEAVIICCNAMKDFAARLTKETENIASSTGDQERKRELHAIAERLKNVPWNPPRDFREAIQALWLTECAAFISYGMTGIFAVGRIDQYLYPYFKKDLDAGIIDEAEARRLMEELLIKFSYNLLMLPYNAKKTGSELGSDSCAPTIGGVKRDGSDAVNELSYIILDAFANVRGLGNTFTIRLSEKNPMEFWKRALAVFRKTSGAALYNDEMAVKALMSCGYTEEEARDYGVIGCVEPTCDGDTFGCTSGNDISLVGALEMTLLNGYLRIMGRRIGPRTGDPRKFKTFGEFMDAYKKQVKFQIDTVAKAVDLKDQAYMEGFPCPYVSLTLKGCIESARDATHGGAMHNFGSVSARGIGTVADSLSAIKYWVFDNRTINMDELIGMLDRNFRGDDIKRAKLKMRSPCYGADNDEADSIAKEVAEYFCREVSSRRTNRNGPYRPSFFSYGMHVFEGMILGATPNGRLAGEPISNSFSPSNGSEREGPTAMLRSIAKIDHSLISNGCAVNLKLLPALLEGEKRLQNMVSLVKAFFSLGGMEIQPNVVSNEILRDAQRNPDKYRDLVVRVSGYSAFFTDLGTPLQDEIISRTEFGRL